MRGSRSVTDRPIDRHLDRCIAREADFVRASSLVKSVSPTNCFLPNAKEIRFDSQFCIADTFAMKRLWIEPGFAADFERLGLRAFFLGRAVLPQRAGDAGVR